MAYLNVELYVRVTVHRNKFIYEYNKNN